MQDIIKLQKEYSESLSQKTNVVGTGVGEKFSGGKPTGSICQRKNEWRLNW